MRKYIAAFLCISALLLSGCGSAVVGSPLPSGSASVETPAPAPETPAETEPPQTQESGTETPPVGAGASLPCREPDDGDLVRVRDYIPDIISDLRYASAENFTGERIYSFDEAWLRYGTVKKLANVQNELKDIGLCLKLWDAFRPVEAQFRLWEVCPDPVYVADPRNGYSSHSRGNTVDVTLAASDGSAVAMPSEFDDFSALADRDYSDCTQEAAENAALLEKCMSENGFVPYSGEWWHFSDSETYPVEQAFTPVEPFIGRADCREFITLREKADTGAEAVTTIPVGETFTVHAVSGDFYYVEYNGAWGFVLKDYAAAE